jgi:hypothetical protein
MKTAKKASPAGTFNFRIYGKLKTEKRYGALCQKMSGELFLGGNIIYALHWATKEEAQKALAELNAENGDYEFEIRAAPHAGG